MGAEAGGFELYGSYTPRNIGGRVQGIRRPETRTGAPDTPLSRGVEGRDWVLVVAEDSDGRRLRVDAPYADCLRDVVRTSAHFPS